MTEKKYIDDEEDYEEPDPCDVCGEPYWCNCESIQECKCGSHCMSASGKFIQVADCCCGAL